MALPGHPPCPGTSPRWGGEPSLTEILSDSIVEAVMRADGVDARALEAQLRGMGHSSIRNRTA